MFVNRFSIILEPSRRVTLNPCSFLHKSHNFISPLLPINDYLCIVVGCVCVVLAAALIFLKYRNNHKNNLLSVCPPSFHIRHSYLPILSGVIEIENKDIYIFIICIKRLHTRSIIQMPSKQWFSFLLRFLYQRTMSNYKRYTLPGYQVIEYSFFVVNTHTHHAHPHQEDITKRCQSCLCSNSLTILISFFLISPLLTPPLHSILPTQQVSQSVLYMWFDISLNPLKRSFYIYR